MSEVGEVNSAIWVLRMVRTRWRERSLERIGCDFKSRSLSGGSGFIVNLHNARKTRNASLMKRSCVVNA